MLFFSLVFRYSDTDPNLRRFQRPCNHNTNSLKCSLVKISDIKNARKKFYEESAKSVQDQKLCHLISVAEPKRKRPRGLVQEEKRKPRNLQSKYYFRVKGKNTVQPVCREFLLTALGITKNRLVPILKAIHGGDIPKEKRGGDRYGQKFFEIKEKIREFLKNLPASESHYNRKKSCRVYISSELNLAVLSKMYNSKNPEYKSSLSMFKRIFYNEFNIGFSSPASDVCGTCINLKNAIKQKDGDKELFISKLKVHRIRANTFYKLLKENPPKSLSFCFDLQQIHPLPKTPVQDAFYLRQISFYTFCCVDVNAKKPFFYTWTEDQASRGSTEIGSALLAHLRSLDFENIELLRLFCDGCGGQNKNAHIVHILALWLRTEAPASVTDLILHFPVRGHSYLPADRVFGRAEKILKKHNVIITPKEYNRFYNQVGQVRKLGVDYQLYDIKNLLETYNKIVGIKDLKRIFLKKFNSKNGVTVKLKGSAFFKFDDNEPFVSIVKRGRNEKRCSLNILPLGNRISSEKKNNVKTLLAKQFNYDDVQWENLPELIFYKNILFEEAPHGEEDVQNDEVEDTSCDCLEDDLAIHI